mmetsp:Transcript_3015/g.7489  ORF Transcript_3015/g.7489 Transcript_3015/m.7489 type:complete len:218 (-) Transcript_3015:208-861(-)
MSCPDHRSPARVLSSCALPAGVLDVHAAPLHATRELRSRFIRSQPLLLPCCVGALHRLCGHLLWDARDGGQHARKQRGEQGAHAHAAGRRDLKKREPHGSCPVPALLLRHPARGVVRLGGCHDDHHVLRAAVLGLLQPRRQRLEGRAAGDVVHEQAALRVLVELVAHLNVVPCSCQVPQIHSQLIVSEPDRLHAIVNSYCGDVFLDELVLAVSLDEA